MNASRECWCWALFSVACVVIITGCTNLPSAQPTIRVSYTCQDFDQARWVSFKFGSDSPEDVTSTIANLRKFDQGKIEFTPLASSFLVAKWTTDRERYEALFQEDRLLRIYVRWSQPLPSFAQIVECLGSPDLYSAVYQQSEVQEFNLGLWYLERGFVVDGYSFHDHFQPPEVTPNYPMRGFTVVAPGNPEQMISGVYLDGDAATVQAEVMRLLKPWPGSIDAIEVDSCLDSPSLCRTDAP